MESGSSGFKNSPYRDHIELKVRIGAIHIEKQTLLYNVSLVLLETLINIIALILCKENVRLVWVV